jgi:triosephosphate isomerase
MKFACVVGNWKMHKSIEEAAQLINELKPGLDNIDGVLSIICPPFTALAPAADLIKGSSLHLGAQNMYWEEKGAYTGEVSPQMIKELAEYVILGHSERRAYFQDTDLNVNRKILAALSAGIKPIFCVGETLEEKESGRTGEVVSRQIRAGLSGVQRDQIDQIIVAYEPIWAIGTGKTATPEGANQIIKDVIRNELADNYSNDTAESTLILYGGSVKPGNARELFGQPDIDGALVGGASLKAEDFIQITEAAV